MRGACLLLEVAQRLCEGNSVPQVCLAHARQLSLVLDGLGEGQR